MQKSITITGIALIIVALILINCNRCNPPEGYMGDTARIQRETTYIKVIDSSGFYEPSFTIIQGARIPDGIDTVKVIQQHFETVFVSDSFKTKFGFVRIHDTLWQNRIIARQIFTDFSVPVYTNTIFYPEKKTTKGFFTGGIGANKYGPQSIDAGFMAQFKKGNAIESTIQYDFRPMLPNQDPWQIKLSYKKLISFHKHKNKTK